MRKETILGMAQHNLPAQSLDPLPKNPTLFGYFEGSDVMFDNSGEDFSRIFSEVMMGEYGVPLSLREEGISMLLMPTGVVIEDDTVKLTYHYAESGGLAVLAVSLTDGACTCEMLHITGGGSEPENVSWDKITGKPDGIEPAIVVLSGSPEEEASYTEEVIAEISAAIESNSRLVLEWGSEQVSVDYAERSSNPVLSFRRDLVSYEVTLDTSADTASVQKISALTSSNLRDTTGDSRTDVMTQKAVTDLSGDIAETTSWADAKTALRQAVLGGSQPVAMYDGTMWVASAFYGQQEGDVTATFMDSFDRTVEVVVTNEGVVTCNAPAILNETYISQETGAATNKIMSQDAVTKKLINTLTLTGDVTGTGTPADGNLSVATTIHGAAKTVTLTGAVTGT